MSGGSQCSNLGRWNLIMTSSHSLPPLFKTECHHLTQSKKKKRMIEEHPWTQTSFLACVMDFWGLLERHHFFWVAASRFLHGPRCVVLFPAPFWLAQPFPH